MNSKVTHINVGNLAENCWFLANEDTKEAVVIDPGAEPDRICAAAEKHGWKDHCDPADPWTYRPYGSHANPFAQSWG